MAAAALAEREVQPDHPHPARGRGRRAARLPARRHPGQGRPLPAAALRRPLRHARPRAGQRLLRARHDRGRAARLHARPHAERLLRDPRRGAEHQPRADEDVPHPARLRLEDGRHRRHHPDRPADRPALGPGRGRRDPRRGPGHLLRPLRRRGRRPPQARAADRRRLRRARREREPHAIRRRAADLDLSDVPDELRRAVGAALRAAGVDDGHLGGRARRRGPDPRAQPRAPRRRRADRRARLPDRRAPGPTAGPRELGDVVDLPRALRPT